ncbi:MAG: type VI secretion system contractile sheath large subunit [Deltaproteobacteria bacterium]|nr:type VI secretion system contractile sheath large subunit [Deltaproteobacteria bacterium]
MPKRSDRADVLLVSEVGSADESLPLAEETPLIIGVLGEFTGRALGEADAPETLADLKPIEIDRDNFDAVMERLGVRFEATLDGGAGAGGEGWKAQLFMRGIESFHPDEILKQIEPLRALLELRRALDDPAKFNAAAAQVRKWIKPSDAATTIPRPEGTSSLLEAIIEETDPSPATPAPKRPLADLDRFVREIVRPHLIQIDLGQQKQLTAAVESLLGEQLRAVLHHKDFQRLEAAWRALHFLVTNAETGTELKIYLLDVSKSALENDLAKAEGIEASMFFKNLFSFSSECGSPWGAFIANYDFGINDVELLDRIARIAQRVGAPFVAAAHPLFLGAESFTEIPSAKTLVRLFEGEPYSAWRAFRKSPQARSAALLLPRFLLRLPYGAESDPVRSFAFEEGVSGRDHEKYLWGNAAFAFAVILAREFTERGWSLDPARLAGRLEGMLLHVYEEAGIKQTKPCAEVLLPDGLTGALNSQGFMLLVSHRDRDFVMIPSARSVADPPALLAGHWSSSPKKQ